MLHSAMGAFYTLGLIASPWIIATNFRRPGQMPTAVAVFGIVFLIALLFWSTAILMHRRKPLGRTLALIAAPFTLFMFWPIGIYSWWFMHSAGARHLYGAKDVN
jgi:hypothetical protein